MFLAAAPYFAHRFRANAWILSHFQSAEISVSCVMNLTSMVILTKMQKNASYPRRISLSLIINITCFVLLSVSTLFWTKAGVYFGFLMLMIFLASLSTGLIQNGLFAYVSGFGRSEYTQAIMTGQAVAGVLPPMAQIIAVLAVPPTEGDGEKDPSQNPESAFIYFLTATAVSVISLLAFFYLLRRRSSTTGQVEATVESARKPTANGASDGAAVNGDLARDEGDHNQGIRPSEQPKASIPLTTLFRKVPFLALGVFLCFAITMVFPVFTASIRSVSNLSDAVFIPVAFLIWNLGDLLGRLATLYTRINLTHYPFALFCLSMARLVFIPLYMLCNIGGRGAVVQSDVFYLIVVQFLFGLSNGYLGSNCMMGAGDWVKEEEREAAGGFMGLCLVGGLTVGSLLSFTLGSR